MTRLLYGASLLSLSLIAAPTLAQHAGHGDHGDHPQPPAPTAAGSAPVPAPAPTPPDPHGGHRMDGHDGHDGHGASAATPVPQQHDAHAGHTMTAARPTNNPHAGHAMPMASDGGVHAHAGHAPTAPNPPVLPPPPGAFSGPAHAADGAYDLAAMTRARAIVRREHGAMTVSSIMIDRLEAAIVDGRNGYAFEADAWTGGDIDRAWLKAKGEGDFGGSINHVELQGLWSHAIDPWFNLQLGVRQDIGHGPDRKHAVIGINGLAPYFFEVDGAVFLSNKGDVTARFEAEYDQRLTQKLILQPSAELNLSAQRTPELGFGSGLTSAELGLRLRYEIVPEFAPYIGVQYERYFGQTARYRRAAGDDVGGWAFLMGIRAWF